MGTKNDFIADKIEEAVGQMFSNFGSQELRPTEYSIFYDSKKYSYWFVVIYFPDSNKLKTGIKQGLCYQIHSSLLDELNKVPEILEIDKSISFDFGKRPTEKLDVENEIGQLIAKMKSSLKVAGKPHLKICDSCGHDFDNHQLLCNLNDDKSAPTHGWIMCPEENCNCFMTWGANYKTEDSKAINRFGRLLNRIFKR